MIFYVVFDIWYFFHRLDLGVNNFTTKTKPVIKNSRDYYNPIQADGLKLDLQDKIVKVTNPGR